MLLLLIALLTPAQAQGPYMWGAGPMLNTIVIPGRYPAGFPPKTKDGKESLLQKTKGDFGFGGHGVLYIGKTKRLGTHAWLTGSHDGSGYLAPNWTLDFDFAGVDLSGVALLAGLGVGLGHQRWKQSGAGLLGGATYILRGQTSANYRIKKMMFEVGLWAEFMFSGPQTWNPSGTDESTSTVPGGFPYPLMGLEATCYFGDFTPPGSGKKRKKRRGRRR